MDLCLLSTNLEKYVGLAGGRRHKGDVMSGQLDRPLHDPSHDIYVVLDIIDGVARRYNNLVHLEVVLQLPCSSQEYIYQILYLIILDF